MLPRLIEQVAILVTAAALLGVPGAALVSLLRLRTALPDSLAVPAGAVLGALVACATTLVQLTATLPVAAAVTVHAAASAVLAAAAIRSRRLRVRRGSHAPAMARGWETWTWLAVVLAALFAWVVRGVVRLDTLYHVSVSRKLVELPSPGFDTVNRFVDGGPNPAYALPGWHALVGWTSWVTGVDPILAWEILPVLVVALGALAAGGLARLVLGTSAAECLGAGAWLLMRVLYPRREVDGDAIAFGAVPGQIVFELALPVVFGAIVAAVWARTEEARRAALAAAVAGIALAVVLHANYVVYVPIVGIGFAAWWMVSRHVARTDLRRLVVAACVVAAACVVFLAVLLPLLAQLENFGNAPEDARIDYHLATTGGIEHIRGGHLYEMLGLPGMLALLAAPVVALRWQLPQFSLVGGGLLAIGAFFFLPPLYELLDATGSLTVGLRINHVAGILLAPVLAGAVLLAAGRAERIVSRRRMVALAASALLVLVASGVAIGYGRHLPDPPGYAAWLALAGVLAWLGLTRRRARPPCGVPAPRAVLSIALVVAIGLGVPVGLVSMRRAVLNAEPLTAGTTAGDLECIGGVVADRLRAVPPGSIVLSDPANSFRAMALAPVYVVGDYKVWNAATADNRTVERLARVNRFFDTSATDRERLSVLEEHSVTHLLLDLGDARWVDGAHRDTPSRHLLERVWRALNSFADVQGYDGAGAASLVGRSADRFELVALDERGRESAVPPSSPDQSVPCNSFALWRVR